MIILQARGPPTLGPSYIISCIEIPSFSIQPTRLYAYLQYVDTAIGDGIGLLKERLCWVSLPRPLVTSELQATLSHSYINLLHFSHRLQEAAVHNSQLWLDTHNPLFVYRGESPVTSSRALSRSLASCAPVCVRCIPFEARLIWSGFPIWYGTHAVTRAPRELGSLRMRIPSIKCKPALRFTHSYMVV